MRRNRYRRMSTCACCWALLFFAYLPLVVRADEITLQLNLASGQVEGTPLAWSSKQVFLLRRDGAMLDFSPNDVKTYQQTSPRFTSYTSSEMRWQLSREFGNGFDVTGTGHFLVVHPKGQRNEWAPRFEQLYRSFAHYFSVRGLNPSPPKFPLVAVVFEKRDDFFRQAAKEGSRISSNVLGYYSPQTNRILLYDQTSSNSSDWSSNAETLIHEATHQSAFNCGIHDRFSPPPRWLAEGLGTMFEAKGVWNSRRYTRQADRINYGRLRDFNKYVSTRREQGALAQLISSDRFFQSDAYGAYAEAWALTFYLVETQPRRYARYLKLTASRPHFTEYRAPDRVKDFTDIFGSNLAKIENRMLEYIGKLK